MGGIVRGHGWVIDREAALIAQWTQGSVVFGAYGLGPQTEVVCAWGGVHGEAPVNGTAGGGCSSSAPGRPARGVGPWRYDAVYKGSGQ